MDLYDVIIQPTSDIGNITVQYGMNSQLVATLFRVEEHTSLSTVRGVKRLPSTGVGTNTDMGADTGVIDNTYGCSYGCSKDTYGL